MTLVIVVTKLIREIQKGAIVEDIFRHKKPVDIRRLVAGRHNFSPLQYSRFG